MVGELRSFAISDEERYQNYLKFEKELKEEEKEGGPFRVNDPGMEPPRGVLSAVQGFVQSSICSRLTGFLKTIKI